MSLLPTFVQEAKTVLLREPQAVASSDAVVYIGRVRGGERHKSQGRPERRPGAGKPLRRQHHSHLTILVGSRLVPPFSFFTSGFGTSKILLIFSDLGGIFYLDHLDIFR